MFRDSTLVALSRTGRLAKKVGVKILDEQAMQKLENFHTIQSQNHLHLKISIWSSANGVKLLGALRTGVYTISRHSRQ